MSVFFSFPVRGPPPSLDCCSVICTASGSLGQAWCYGLVWSVGCVWKWRCCSSEQRLKRCNRFLSVLSFCLEHGMPQMWSVPSDWVLKWEDAGSKGHSLGAAIADLQLTCPVSRTNKFYQSTLILLMVEDDWQNLVSFLIPSFIS